MMRAMASILKFSRLGALMMMLAAGACQGDEGMSVYKSDQVNLIEVARIEAGGVLLHIDPMLESAWYLAGADLTETETAVELSLIRCRIGQSCKVDLAATTHPGTADPYELTVPQTAKPIVVTYADDTRAEVYTPAP